MEKQSFNRIENIQFLDKYLDYNWKKISIFNNLNEALGNEGLIDSYDALIANKLINTHEENEGAYRLNKLFKKTKLPYKANVLLTNTGEKHIFLIGKVNDNDSLYYTTDNISLSEELDKNTNKKLLFQPTDYGFIAKDKKVFSLKKAINSTEREYSGFFDLPVKLSEKTIKEGRENVKNFELMNNSINFLPSQTTELTNYLQTILTELVRGKNIEGNIDTLEESANLLTNILSELKGSIALDMLSNNSLELINEYLIEVKNNKKEKQNLENILYPVGEKLTTIDTLV